MVMRSTTKNVHLFVSVIFTGVTQQWHSQKLLQLFATSAMSSEHLNHAFRSWCGTWPQRRCICLPMTIGFQRQKGPRGRRCVSWQLWWMTRRWWREQPTASKSKPAISEVGSPEFRTGQYFQVWPQLSKDVLAHLCVGLFYSSNCISRKQASCWLHNNDP